jgi:CHASE3 domain sensor protein
VPITIAVTLLVIAWLLAYFFVEKRTDIYTNNNNSMETIIEDVEIITAKSDSESSQKLLMRVSK